MISLIIPVYNEAENIQRVVEDVLNVCSGADYEIIAVNDGSQDDTKLILRGLAQQKAVGVIEHKTRRGYDNALKTGIGAARGEIIVILEGDGQTDIRNLKAAVKLLKEQEIITGWRQNGQSTLRQMNSRCYKLLLNGLFRLKVRDINGKPKIFWKKDFSHVRSYPVKSCIFDFLLLLEANKKGFVIKELPVRHLPRLSGTSKMDLPDLVRMVALILKLKLAESK